MMLLDEEILLSYALSFTGLPYRWGGSNPLTGFDCSGLVVELLKSIGVIGPHSDYSAHSLCELYKNRVVNSISFGCLSFYKGHSSNTISHVGFCLNEYLMIEAGGGDSSVINSSEAQAKDAFVRIRPITYRKDLHLICKPKYPWESTVWPVN